MFIIAVIFAMTGYSCKKKGVKHLDQGEIHYNIEYSGNLGLPREVLPKNLIVSFKKDKILFEITGLGKSGIANLNNPEKGIFDTYFTFFTRKYYYPAESAELNPGLEAMEGMILKKTSKTSVICGFNCKNVEATFPSDEEKVYNIWYTNEIQVENPNISSPFSQIDGILMEFVFLFGPTELHFTAENVYKMDIPDITFDRKADFVRVSRDDINTFINKMINP